MDRPEPTTTSDSVQAPGVDPASVEQGSQVGDSSSSEPNQAAAPARAQELAADVVIVLRSVGGRPQAVSRVLREVGGLSAVEAATAAAFAPSRLPRMYVTWAGHELCREIKRAGGSAEFQQPGVDVAQYAPDATPPWIIEHPGIPRGFM